MPPVSRVHQPDTVEEEAVISQKQTVTSETWAEANFHSWIRLRQVDLDMLTNALPNGCSPQQLMWNQEWWAQEMTRQHFICFISRRPISKESVRCKPIKRISRQPVMPIERPAPIADQTSSSLSSSTVNSVRSYRDKLKQAVVSILLTYSTNWILSMKRI